MYIWLDNIIKCDNIRTLLNLSEDAPSQSYLHSAKRLRCTINQNIYTNDPYIIQLKPLILKKINTLFASHFANYNRAQGLIDLVTAASSCDNIKTILTRFDISLCTTHTHTHTHTHTPRL
eukprot:GHVR01016853.1.p2 GENE.GHVR01016853.1~~GHVR01016853.1.p2  ORF type:complete len:130 (+),score=65.82 GHVR01016853.1:31-390(+)